MMYDWFNKHLDLKQKSPVEEKPFVPVPPVELSVFDEKHPLPKDSVNAAKLRAHLTKTSDEQIEALKPKSAEPLANYRKVFGPALRVMLSSHLPEGKELEVKSQGEPKDGDVNWRGYVIGRRGQGEQVPVLVLKPKGFKGTAVVWVDAKGKSSLVDDNGKLVGSAKVLLDAGVMLIAPDVFGTGELALDKPMAVNERMPGYTFGYNRPLLSQRAHDILTTIGFARRQEGVKTIHLLGRGKAGPWTLLARGLCGDVVSRTAADVDRFRFDGIKTMNDEMMLPGAIKYGGLPALAGLAVPGELLVHNHRGTGMGDWTKAAYKAAESEKKLETSGDKMDEDKVVKWLLR
jgi:hypothetical protein